MLWKRDNYAVYHPSIKESLLVSACGLLVGAMVGYLFYESFLLALAAAAIGLISSNRYYKQYKIQKRGRRLLLQFRDLLESLSVSLSAGSNMQDAFLAAEKDMDALHGAGSSIVQELQIMNAGLAANMSIEQLLHDFGQRSAIVDIRSFASVFETCFRLGGNINEVVKMTCSVICDKIDVRQEILTVVSAKKAEQNAMLIMPVVFLALLKGVGAGVVDMTSVTGLFSTTLAILLFLSAYWIGKRILNIGL